MYTSAIILSGGASQRMGTDKALLSFWNKPLLQYVAHNMRRLTTNVLVSGSSIQYKEFGHPVIPDRYTDKGPMGGLHSTLLAMSSEEAFVCTCDAPLAPYGLFSYLSDQISADALAAVAVHKGQIYPLLGLFRRKIVPYLQESIESNKLSITRLLKELPVDFVEIDEKLSFYEPYIFLNTNTEADYKTLIDMEQQVKVLYFGITGDITGKSEDFIEEFTTVSSLRKKLYGNYPNLVDQPFKMAVNHVLATDETILRGGDEVALLPPFAGG